MRTRNSSVVGLLLGLALPACGSGGGVADSNGDAAAAGGSSAGIGGGSDGIGGAPGASAGGATPNGNGGSSSLPTGSGLPCTTKYDMARNANPINADVGIWPEGCLGSAHNNSYAYYPDPEKDPSPKKGIRMFFHGDWAGMQCPGPAVCENALMTPGNFAQWDDPRGIAELHIVGKNVDRGGAGVGVSWMERNSDAELDEIVQLIQDARKTFQIPDNGPILAYSLSGGSNWLTRDWIPRRGHLFPGAYAVFCGGASDFPVASWPWDPASSPATAKIKLHFSTATGDPLYDGGKAATDWASWGFSVTSDFPPGGSHCSGIDTIVGSHTLFEAWLAENPL